MTQIPNYDIAWSDLENGEWWIGDSDLDMASRETLVRSVLAVADTQADIAGQLRAANEHLGTIAQSLSVIAAALKESA